MSEVEQLPIIFDPATSVMLPDLQRELWTAYEASGKMPIATNIPGNTREGLEMIAKCDQPGALRLLDFVGKELTLWGFRCKPVSKEVDKGEEVQLVHSVLIDTNGQRYETVGQGIPPCLAYLALLHGMQPWDGGGVKVKVVAKATGKGNPFIQLEEVTG